MKLHFCLKVTSFQEPIFDPEIFSDAAGILSPRKDTKKDAINVVDKPSMTNKHKRFRNANIQT